MVSTAWSAEEYVGLGQVRLRNYGACRDDLAAPACALVRARLLSGLDNLYAVVGALRANRKLCGAAPERYLAGYQGNGCHPTRLTKKVLARWRELERRTRRRHRRHTETLKRHVLS